MMTAPTRPLFPASGGSERFRRSADPHIAAFTVPIPHRAENGYHEIALERGEAVTDVLIRDVPDDVISAIEAKAKRLGLSRTEYLRRQMARVATATEEPVTVDALRAFSETFTDLGDADVMRGAWE